MLTSFRNNVLSDIKSSNIDQREFIAKLKKKKEASATKRKKRTRGALHVVPFDGLCGWCKGACRPAIQFDFHPMYAECGKCLCMWEVRKKKKKMVIKK